MTNSVVDDKEWGHSNQVKKVHTIRRDMGEIGTNNT